MAKKIKVKFKVQARGGQATPAPPIGPALGQHGVNINEFITRFNGDTKDKMGELIPAIITVYEDKSFDLVYKTAPTSELLKKAAGIEKGSSKPLQEKVGKISRAKIREVAEKKMSDLNANDIEGAMRLVEGTARQMGLVVED
jgi:large subunit ribosomal protein L11